MSSVLAREEVLVSDEFDLGDAVSDATNVLLVAPGVGDTADQLCCDVVSARGTVPEHVIGVTICGSPADMIETWRAQVDADPSLSCLAVDGVARSAGQMTAPAVGAATIEHVDASEPVRKLGEKIGEKLHGGAETTVCFDSITDLCESLGQEAAFEFLHVLCSRVRASGATGYYYIDRTVHDEETMTLYSTLFDAVVETGSDPTE